ncbi:GNAT family N-acetyltransferase [Microbacterium sp. VKM Ac-2923]|uniref:GNAT family N-acetyltransferase n=1 Tax=Microbacterium sp. VKM Ac-2923 TaxID=2929476 RepID=UPI001FB2FD43|nr:GNAT family N-acetyltransferase [Microbacterium sp. VKM Ac-2923]MCJ1708802.1 N-acetyltransferase family protein [Microbacterium sp. VKM Ac-2923]
MTLVRALERADWAAVEDIYREGIDGGNATFETETPTWDAFDRSKTRFGRLVAVDDAHAVVGWVAASPVSTRPAYRGVVEHSLYVSSRAQGHGVGTALLRAFIAMSEMSGVWTIQSSVFPENTASLRLHEALGFREVGRRERIARSLVGPWAGQWRDTVLIERRSSMNGRT